MVLIGKIFDFQPPTSYDRVFINTIVATRGWYGAASASFTPAAAAPTTTTLAAEPFIVGKTSKWDKIQLEVAVLVAGSTLSYGNLFR